MTGLIVDKADSSPVVFAVYDRVQTGIDETGADVYGDPAIVAGFNQAGVDALKTSTDKLGYLMNAKGAASVMATTDYATVAGILAAAGEEMGESDSLSFVDGTAYGEPVKVYGKWSASYGDVYGDLKFFPAYSAEARSAEGAVPAPAVVAFTYASANVDSTAAVAFEAATDYKADSCPRFMAGQTEAAYAEGIRPGNNFCSGVTGLIVDHAFDLAAIAPVKDLLAAINGIGTVAIDSKAAIDAARAAYDKLTDEQKALVPAATLKVLTDAEAALAAIESTIVDNAAAAGAVAKIDAIGTVTVDSKATIDAARAAYDALTPYQKALVPQEKYDTLVNAEVAYKQAVEKANMKDNTITAKGKTVSLKVKNLKKKNQAIAITKAATVSGAQGAVTYSKIKADKNNGKFAVASNGKITVKKGLKKGTYKLQVKASAAGDETHNPGSATFTTTIKVK